MPKLSDEIGKVAERYAAMKAAPKATIGPAEKTLRGVGREMLHRWNNPYTEAGLESEVFTEPLHDYVDTKFKDPVGSFLGHTIATSVIPKTRGDVIRMGVGASKLGALKGTNPDKMLKVLKAQGLAQQMAQKGREITKGVWDKIVKMEGADPTLLQRAGQTLGNLIPVGTPSLYSMNRKKIDKAFGAGR